MIDLYGYGPAIFAGAWVTLKLAVLSLVLALVFGVLTALTKLAKTPVFSQLATFYTTLIRGVPDIVTMFLVYFGGQQLIIWLSDWLYDRFEIDYYTTINEFAAGVATIGLIFGAYMAESIRGAYLAVPKGQLEAAYSYGMSPTMAFFRIQLPQLLRLALPGISNNWQVLLKTTALVSVIGLQDMVTEANRASKTVHEPFLFFIPVALMYLLFTAISELAFKWLQTRANRGQ